MQPQQHLQHAIQVASEAHGGQMDKTGHPYVEHCRRVADLVATEEEQIVAYLHDIPEKRRAGHWIGLDRKDFLLLSSPPWMR